MICKISGIYIQKFLSCPYKYKPTQAVVDLKEKKEYNRIKSTGGTKVKILIDLFLTFARIGLFTFGGGYAMIPLIDDICVKKKKWITHDEMMYITVIAESTPGPVAVNAATFVGYNQAGIPGAIIATIGIALPSFAVIFIISLFFDSFLKIKIVASAFRGIKIAVGVLILDVGISMMKNTEKKPLPLIILFASFAAMMLIDIFSVNFSSVLLLLIAAAVSLAVFTVSSKIRKDGEKK